MRFSATPNVSHNTTPRGRPFAKGNSGRRPGSKNRSSVVAASLLAGEKTALLRKAIELALNGDVPMLKFLLGRLLPRDRLIEHRAAGPGIC